MSAAEEDSGPPAAAVETVDPAPRVLFATSLGDLVVELDRTHTPLTVNNFLNYVSQHSYDNTLIHQVESGFMALGGCYTADRREVPVDYSIRNEAHSGSKNGRGTIAMSRPAEAIDGATSQFFFNLADNPALDYRGDSASDYGYCAFGRVVAGQEVLGKIAAAPVVDDQGLPHTPQTPIVIRSIRRMK